MRTKRTACLPGPILAFALALGLAGDDAARAERWAIVPDGEIEQSGLADLITAQLSGIDSLAAAYCSCN